MRSLNEFDVSDIAASNHPGWRVRWGAEGSDAVLLVDMKTKKDQSRWCLAEIFEGSRDGIIPEADGTFSTAPGCKVAYHYATVDGCKGDLPKILQRCCDYHYADIPAPRRINPSPILTPKEADELEMSFFEKLVSPYLENSVVYSIQQSGTALANRLGVRSRSIYVNHYQPNTFQDDPKVKPTPIPFPSDPTSNILILDDMISSGRTAAAVIQKFLDAGFQRIRYCTLFDIQASREVFKYESFVQSFKVISNFYWLYGRGMDMKTEDTRALRLLCGADKAFEDTTMEDIEELRNFFRNQTREDMNELRNFFRDQS